MSWADVAIPGVVGLLLVINPGAFTKAEGEAGAVAHVKLRKIGAVLLGVAALYAFLAVVQGR